MASLHNPRTENPRAILDEILPPLGLTARDGPAGSILIVRSPKSRLSPQQPTEPRPSYPVFVEEIVVTPGKLSIMRQDPASPRTVGSENVLLVPVDAVFEDQGTFVVHVEGWRGVETRRVDLGESDDRVVVVMGGVRENERVSLSVPSNGRPSASPSRPPGTGPIPSFGNAGATP